METYYLNNKEQDAEASTRPHEHELHRLGCHYFPSDVQKIGVFNSPESALLAAMIWAAMYRKDWNVDGCAFCCPSVNSDC